MSLFNWNESKLARIAELQSENAKLRKMCDEVLESEHRMNVQAMRLQKEKDELIVDLRRKLDDSLTTICKLHERMAVLENAIRTDVSIAGL
jgi:predicted RNase H-like nuclease (RuvC/YqgF family)